MSAIEGRNTIKSIEWTINRFSEGGKSIGEPDWLGEKFEVWAPAEVAKKHDKIAEFESLLQRIAAGHYVIEDLGDGLSTVYTGAEWITRHEAEKMMAFLVKEKHGIDAAKFVWDKVDYCVVPA